MRARLGIPVQGVGWWRVFVAVYDTLLNIRQKLETNGAGYDSIDFIDKRIAEAEHLPNYSIKSLALIGEGWDNSAYELNGELILRASKETDAAEREPYMRREAGILSLVRNISPVAVPEPLFVDIGRGAMAYFKV